MGPFADAKRTGPAEARTLPHVPLRLGGWLPPTLRIGQRTERLKERMEPQVPANVIHRFPHAVKTGAYALELTCRRQSIARESGDRCVRASLSTPLGCRCQSACKPGSVLHAEGRPFIFRVAYAGALRDLPERRSGNGLAHRSAGGRSYSVLLPVGFTVRAALPRRRWALTPPFHPDPVRGGLLSVALSLSALDAPGGCYPPPCFRGARTFLPRNLSVPTQAVARPTGLGEVARLRTNCDAYRWRMRGAGTF